MLVEGVPPTKWGRDDPPEHRREVQEGSEPLPGPLPGRHRLGVLDPHIGLGEVGQSLPGSLLVRGGVNGLESGRDLPAVPVGDEPHRGADQVDHTGLDRRLGPGRLDRLRQAGEPVTFPRALRSRAGGAPSTIRTSLTPLLASSAHTSRPSRRLPPRPGPRYLSHVLDSVHVHPDRDVSRAGGDPVINADLDPDRACGRPPGRGLLQRAALPLQDSLGNRVGDPRNGPRAEHPR